VSVVLTRFNVRKVRMEGFSGVVHEVELVEYGGRMFILIRDCDEQVLIDCLSKLIVCYDLNLPPLIMAKSKLSKVVEETVSELGGLVIKVK